MAEKIKGRKRHVVVDTMGNLLAIVVHAANIPDTKSGINPAKSAHGKYPTIKKFCGDDGYRKSFQEAVTEQLKLGVDISKRIKPEFEVLPLRWKVEHTFNWVNHSHRLSKDYEIRTNHEENMFMISHLHTLLKRYWIQVLTYCENDFCIYNENNKCIVDLISINSVGNCDSCILVNISEDYLKIKRKELLDLFGND